MILVTYFSDDHADGDGYDYVELKQYADYLTREIELVDGVGKVSIAGDQQEHHLLRCHLSVWGGAEPRYVDGYVTVSTTKQCVVSAGEVMLEWSKLNDRSTVR